MADQPVTCLAIGDPHFQVNNIPDCQDLITRILEIIDKRDPDFVVILGDLLHTHEKIHVTPFKMATKLILGIAERVSLFLLIGNHDYISNQQFLTDNHAFNSFKSIENVTICDRVIRRRIGGLPFIFCPYVPPERFEEALNTCKKGWDDAECIFAHQEFYGCRFNPVMTSTEGDLWPDEYPLVVSGHIHDSQMLQDNIYYVGSSMQHAFGESPNKTVAFLRFFSSKKIPFKLTKIKLNLTKKEIVYKDLSDISNFTPKQDVKTKLVVKGSSEDFQVFRKGAEYKKLQKQGIVISFSPVAKEPLKQAPTNKKKSVIDILEELVVDSKDPNLQNSFNMLKESNS